MPRAHEPSGDLRSSTGAWSCPQVPTRQWEKSDLCGAASMEKRCSDRLGETEQGRVLSISEGGWAKTVQGSQRAQSWRPKCLSRREEGRGTAQASVRPFSQAFPFTNRDPSPSLNSSEPSWEEKSEETTSASWKGTRLTAQLSSLLPAIVG